MPIELKMPALSPTMEEGTLAKWLVNEGDQVKAGDVLAEIETDKATMEFEAVDEGIVRQLLVPEGTEGVKVGAVIALVGHEDEEAESARLDAAPITDGPDISEPEPAEALLAPKSEPLLERADDEVIASPLARRLAKQLGMDLTGLNGSGPNGRILKVDLRVARQGAERSVEPILGVAEPPFVPSLPAALVPVRSAISEIPHEVSKLSNMRKVIARRLTESKQQVPHIYLTVDIRLDALLALRTELNASLAVRDVKLSVNDLLIKALAVSLIEVPACNVQFAGDELLTFGRADISVAVSIPKGLVTPVIVDAGSKSISKIAAEMKELATRARDGRLQPHEYTGGTASLSNMGMYGIKQFEAVINPPQAMIMAIGAGEQRPCISQSELAVVNMMSVTGSFDHRVIDGADGARLMNAFREVVENPIALLA